MDRFRRAFGVCISFAEFERARIFEIVSNRKRLMTATLSLWLLVRCVRDEGESQMRGSRHSLQFIETVDRIDCWIVSER